ncbi:serine/threonine-protein kinase [Candidatus Viridilinea mediisalina]|uniref:non-specific serine/threonine protein kinase n=1 Tax=Candidatus Viridilinea mediisalina TaxID=2024553 RepID=A0A2A6RJH0_9CHLR|nr:serine/threonine-protein kinase [Candidatus Viridilinea mediisalina]PDW03008.1 hypothetical protein CJ255_11095 [Candidatus Viridilinea mediisalina]
MADSQLIAGRFELGDLIGQGGMGYVYRGRDHKQDREVAIKLLREELGSNTDQVRRFAREGEALRTLNHPNIVKVLASVEEQGRHYIVMEYVTGGSLGTLLKQQPQLPVERALQIALDLADALTRAHRLKIIHRDIKPMNVLLAADGTPRLTDFGVAHMGDHSRMTETGSMVGTYAYLSPEACNGQHPDERTDIWAFGVLLYEMLAGQRPFAGDQPGAIITAILTRDPPNLAELRPDVPPALVRLVQRMLVKSRDERIASVRQVGAELEAIMRGETTPPEGGMHFTTQVLHEQAASRFNTPTNAPNAAATPEPASPLAATPAPAPTPAPSPTPAAKPTRLWRFAGAVGVLLLFGMLLWMSGNLGGGASTTARIGEPSEANPAVMLEPTLANNPAPANDPSQLPSVEPVEAGEYMVLVSDFEALDAEQRDVARFIGDDLRQQLEVDIPHSNIRVRRYPQVLVSEDVAATAERLQAAVVIWGSYNREGIQAHVQLGDTSGMPNTINRRVLERTANLRLNFSDERSESLAPHVLQVLNVVSNAEGDIYAMFRNVAMRNRIRSGVAVEGTSVAANVSRYLSNLTSEPAVALEAINQALNDDGGNPMLYLYRSGANLRLGNIDEVERDGTTAIRQTQGRWVMPFYGGAYIAYNRGAYADALNAINVVVFQRPNDWYALTFRGAIQHALGNYEAARADLNQAVALGPDVSFPYKYLMLIMLREGEVEDAQQIYTTVMHDFPDQLYGAHILDALVGKEGNVIGPFLYAFGELSFGAFDETIRYLDASLALREDHAEAHFLRGFAHCNMGEYANAEADYSRALALAPDFTLLHLLRAEVRQGQDNSTGAAEDVASIQASEQQERLAPFVAATLTGELGCRTLLVTP